jgi:hypothetical protein
LILYIWTPQRVCQERNNKSAALFEDKWVIVFSIDLGERGSVDEG